MALDRRAFEKLAAAKAAARTRVRPSIPVERLRQAAVPMERLTGSEHWDTFLRYAENLQELDRAAIASIQERLLAPEFLAEAQVMALRHAAAIHAARISARQQVMDIPKSVTQLARESEIP